MKRKTGWILLISTFALLVVLAVLAGFNFSPLTPWGGTRLAILFSGYPVNAMTTGLEYHTDEMGESYYILSNPPYEAETDSSLYQWNIDKAGIFYWAHFGVD